MNMSLDDEAIASFLESFDERARRSNARYSDGDDRAIFSPGFDEYFARREMAQVLGIKHNDPDHARVSLCVNDWSKKALRRFGYILSGNTTMKNLFMDRDAGPQADDAWLYAGIRQNRSIKRLMLRGISPCTNHIGVLATFLTTNPALKELALTRSLDSARMDIIAASLMQRSMDNSLLGLKELDLSGNYFSNHDFNILTAAVKQSKRLKSLALSDNGINGKAVPALVKLLSSNESVLEKLDLSDNLLFIVDALALIGALQSNDKLTTLNLRGNIISDSEQGWGSVARRVLNLVCDVSSVSGVANSNHTLSSLGYPINPSVIRCNRQGVKPMYFGVPFSQYLSVDDTKLVRSSLILNYGDESQSLKARRKVYLGHVRGDFHLGDASIDISLLPRIVALIGHAFPAVSHCKSCCETSAKLLQYPTERGNVVTEAFITYSDDGDEEENDDGNDIEQGQEDDTNNDDGRDEEQEEEDIVDDDSDDSDSDSDQEREQEKKASTRRHMLWDTTRLGTVYNIVRARPELCCEKHSNEEKLRAELAVSQAKNQMLRFEMEGLEEEIKRLKAQLAAASSGK